MSTYIVLSKLKRSLSEIYQKFVKTLSGHRFGRFYLVLTVHNLITSYLKPTLVDVQEHKMFLDSKDSLSLATNKIHEPFETEVVQKIIKKGNVVLDIGANIGYYTLLFAKLVGTEGRIFAFEPDPDNFALLKKNVEINGYRNIILVQKAVSNKNGNIKLYLSHDNKGDHRIYDSNDGRKCIEIGAVRLDDYFKEFNGRIDFIKMDIQGAEGGAVQGMLNLLNKNGDAKIITEFWPIGLKRFGVEPNAYLNLLQENGFELYHLNETEKKLEPADIPALLETYRPESENFTNLLCTREKLADINLFERKICSQQGEDGIIEFIFYTIGTTNKFYVEIGVGNGTECNTRYLFEKKGWTGIMIDAMHKSRFIKKELVSAENINDLFRKYLVPQEFDLLSIDIDGNDYWIWRALKHYSPRVVVIEYNSVHLPMESKVIKYEPNRVWDGTNYFGASLLALVKLARVKGYTLIGCDSNGVNAFFVRDDLIEGHFEIKPLELLYKPTKYGKCVHGVHVGHPPSDKTWESV